MPKKQSFFEKLTGTINQEEDVELNKVEENDLVEEDDEKSWIEEDEVGELPVDVYDTPNEIIIKTMVAGVKPENLDVDITREMVTIKGERKESRVSDNDNFYHKELYWGSFSRTILLPSEIEVEEAEATSNDGLLIIKLPKINKDKKTKLKIRSK